MSSTSTYRTPPPSSAFSKGESGITGVAAAVANAVHHASGVRVRDLPLTPDRVLRISANL
ncbi:MAG: hypothetical protein H7Y15_18330 [Pseudonocardia sp.]|nr:hypothetical protein [Pseudonocardia sp.]